MSDPIKTGSPHRRTGRPFASELRAFVSESRIGGGAVSAASWGHFAKATLGACADESEVTVTSALNALARSKEESVGNATNEWLDGSVQNLLREKLDVLQRRSDSGELYTLLKEVFNCAGEVIAIDDDDDDDDVISKVTGSGTRSGIEAKKSKKRRRHSSDIDTVEQSPSATDAHAYAQSSLSAKRTKPSRRPHARRPFAFHLLKTHGVRCEGDAYIGIEDVVACGGRLCVLCTFQLDMEWMLGALPALETFRKIIIVHGGSDEEETQWCSYLQARGVGNTVQFIRPELPAYGTMHTKMFLLFYDVGCRVCIHSANMVEQDWEMKTQAAYMRDFPITESKSTSTSTSASPLRKRVAKEKEKEKGRSSENENDFGRELSRYMTKCLSGKPDVSEVVKQHLQQVDFSSAGAALVASVPGRHGDVDLTRFGHMRLRALLSKHGSCDSGNDPGAAVCQFSSLGSVQESWLLEEFGASLFAQRQGGGISSNMDGEKRKIQLVYPTVEQVQQSNEGLHAGTSIPVRTKNLMRSHITSRLHAWDAVVSKRERAMPHMKSFLRYEVEGGDEVIDVDDDDDDDDDEVKKKRKNDRVHVKWLVIGSFNLSVAAWGRLQMKGTKLHILSYELGVLFCAELWCKPAFALPQAVVKYVVRAAAGVGAGGGGKGGNGYGKTKNRLVLYDFNDDDADSKNSNGDGDGDCKVMLPVPYQVPPRRFRKGTDTPWTIERCTMM